MPGRKSLRSLVRVILSSFLSCLSLKGDVWRVDAYEGSCFLSNEEGREIRALQAGEVLSPGSILVSGEEARIFLKYGDRIQAFLGSLSAVQLENSPSSLLLGRGSLLIKQDQGRLRVAGKRVEQAVSEGIFLLEATSVGGLKLINLDRKLQLGGDTDSGTSLSSGQLVFLQPPDNRLSRKLDIYLAELIATSTLIRDFPVEGAWRKNLLARTLLQSERIEGYTKAIIGDATGDENVQVFLEEEN
jgi:hypothetical protein